MATSLGSKSNNLDLLRILLVEDSASFRDAVIQLLGVYNDIDQAENLAEARSKLASRRYDVVILDKFLPDGSGVDLIASLKEENPEAVAIMLTGDSDFGSVKRCIQAGADDYVVKSANVIPDLLVRIPLAVSRAASLRSLKRIEEQTRVAFKYEIVGRSHSVMELREKIANLRGTASSVLITGESGTGKELIARRLNAIEEGVRRPFVALNCGAIPETLMESELFGHRRGAFTGAIQDRAGKFEEANGGDLFLDEIGELPLSAQAKLLRVLQDGQLYRVGDSKPVQVQVRVIAATHRNLEEMVAKRQFREDLYYRLNVVRLHAAPLRERKEDIADLAQFFLLQLGSPNSVIKDAALARLREHSWPGNIRELKNAVERALISARLRKSLQIEAEDVSLQTGLQGPHASTHRLEAALPQTLGELTREHYEEFLRTAEREYLSLALELVGDRVTELALRTDVPRSTLFAKFKSLGITRRSYERAGLTAPASKDGEAQHA